MISIIYTIVIFPLVQVIELFFLFIFSVSRNTGISLCGVSLAITLLTLPLYQKAELLQAKERDAQKKMALKTKKIKSVFIGDERHMILSAYYRQNHYHPIYALRSTFGLLIQIPFFIAAWSFITDLDILNGYSFIGIADIGKPDGLLYLFSLRINVLPLMMTLITILSSIVYTKGFALKEKMQLYVMAGLFLILLYNSPAALVLYWTFNNLFSLLKNIIQRFGIPIRKIYFLMLPFIALLEVYILYFHRGSFRKRLFLFILIIIIIIIPLILAKVQPLIKKIKNKFLLNNDFPYSVNSKFILSILILFVLIGLVIPSALILSSPEEFSFIESNKSPFPFLFNTLVQSFGLVVLWPVCFYLFFSLNTKKFLSVLFSLLFLYCIANTFLVFENFGSLDNILVFSDLKSIPENIFPIIINILILIALTVLFYFLWNRFFFRTLQIIFLCTLLLFGIINVFKIQTTFKILSDDIDFTSYNADKIEPFFNFSKEDKNILLIMLDGAMASYIPEILMEKPELNDIFSDFTWYKNCVSFHRNTFIGAPPVFGGYEYSPGEINKKNTVPLVDKRKEAFLVLPRLFLDSSWSVTINDSPANIEWYRQYSEINTKKLTENYTQLWLNNNHDISFISITDRLKNNLIRFCFFKTAPLILRNFIYDDAYWLTKERMLDYLIKGKLALGKIHDYVFLNYLPEMTKISRENKNNFIEIYSSITHNPVFLQVPDYIPSANITNKGSGKSAEEPEYHVNMAAFLSLSKYFNYLDEHGVYDNTRIIIVSDHGGDRSDDYGGNFPLPNGHSLLGFHALLLFKDFNARGEGSININMDLMTNADAALLAVKDIINNPVNPFTQQPLLPQKENGLDIATVRNMQSHGKYLYRVKPSEWLHVKDNIFVESNWSIKK